MVNKQSKMKKTRTELKKQYQQNLQEIKHQYHIQPSIIIEYLYMQQDNKEEARQMLTQEIQRSLLYNNTLNYSNYSESVDKTITHILKELSN